jgi:uncharacterized tellurite resistance protein B-like protein
MPDESHLLLMELTIQFAMAVARADGPVTPQERELLRQQVRSRFGYNPALLNRAEAFCAHYETAAIDLDSCLLHINQRFTIGHRTALIAFASQLVAASGKRGVTAEPFLYSVAQRLGVQPVILASQTQPAQPGVSRSPQQERNSLHQPAVTANITNVLEEQRQRAAQNSQQSAAQKPSTKPDSSRSPATARTVPTDTLSSPRPSPAAKSVAASATIPPRPAVAAPSPLTPMSVPPPPTLTRDECLTKLEIQRTTPLSADLIRRQWNLISKRFDLDRAAKMGAKHVILVEADLAALRQAAAFLLEPMGEMLEINPSSPASKELRHNPDLDDVFGM